MLYLVYLKIYYSIIILYAVRTLGLPVAGPSVLQTIQRWMEGLKRLNCNPIEKGDKGSVVSGHYLRVITVLAISTQGMKTKVRMNQPITTQIC